MDNLVYYWCYCSCFSFYFQTLQNFIFKYLQFLYNIRFLLFIFFKIIFWLFLTNLLHHSYNIIKKIVKIVNNNLYFLFFWKFLFQYYICNESKITILNFIYIHFQRFFDHFSSINYCNSIYQLQITLFLPKNIYSLFY
jgi:hypothetical protein